MHATTRALALLILAWGLASPPAPAQTVTVNFNDDLGPLERVAQGYLYSWWHTRESPLHGNLELRPNSWRIGYWGTWDYEYQPMLDQGVDHIQVILTDAFRNRAHATVGGFSHDVTWQPKGYVETVESTVQLVNDRGWDHIAFDLINEPDAFGIDGISDWYRDAWVPAFRKVRELRPQAKIVGPGFFSANLSHLRTFLEKAKADNVVPDILSQHLLDNQSRNVVESYTAQLRALLAEYGLADRPISFNEYINPGHVAFVEDVVDAICQGERAGVDTMMHSSWDDSGELPPWNSTGDAACFDGVLSVPAQRERACYWTYKFYGDMAGRRLGNSGSASGWDCLASYDAAEPVARVLLGGGGTSGNVTLTLNNLPAAFGSSISARIERVTSNGNDLTAAPTLHASSNFTVSGGTANIAITGIPGRTATMVTIRPASAPAKPASPTFSPLRGNHWKPITVTLSGPAGATLRYTTDGSAPTASSDIYTGPIPVAVTTTVRAIAISGGATSETANATFTIRKYDHGVFGEYFNNNSLSGTPALTRGDPKIDFNYGTNRLDASLPYDNFSARWTGRLRPYVTGTHQLRTVTDDGVRLYLDNVLVIDGWGGLGDRTASVNLTAGQDHELKMEFYDGVGDSVARLFWTPPGRAEEIVPTCRLFPPTSPSGANLLVGMGTTWNYLAPASAAGAPAASWNSQGFNDAGWTSASARIGFGDLARGEATTIDTSGGKPRTIYFRKSFNVANPAGLSPMLDLAVVRDSGAIVYVNGTEVLRDTMPAGTVSYDTLALGEQGDSNETTPARGQVPRSLLVAGANTIAVEVHNSSPDNEDMGFDCALTNPASNTPPVVGPIANRTHHTGQPVKPVGFAVDDGELFASLVTATATSSNQGLIPDASLVLGGYGRSRTLSFTPAAGQTGSATITVTASDGIATSAPRTFTLTVANPPPNTPPTLSDVTDKTIAANVLSNEIRFTVGDLFTEPGLLTVSATSSNQALVPDANLYFNGTGDWRTLSILPATNQGGTATITVTVSDGSLAASDSFVLTVADPPPPGGGAGLVGEYFNNLDLAGTPVLTRTEAVNFDWGSNSPGPGVNADNFTVRWSGFVEATVSGNHVFRTATDDGVRLWVNGALVINDWNAHATANNDSAPIILAVGTKYPIVMEYFDSGGGATARLQWTTPLSGSFTAIPADRLYASSGTGTMLTYDFDDATFQGWTDLTPANSNTGPRNWAIAPPAFPGATQAGAGAIGQDIQGGTQDSSHPTLRLRSPEFSLNGAGALSAWLRGGTGSSTSLAGTSVAALPANSSSPGFQGIALRNATTGQYVLSGGKASSGDDWQQVTFSSGQLAALDQNARYTLDLIDQGHGGWGWTTMDSVSIPGSLEAGNSSPTISDVPDQTITANSTTGAIPFTVGDNETAPASLTVSGSSSNTTLVPNANITFGGTGANRTVTVTPAAGLFGTATITVTVSDGALTAGDTFLLTVTSGGTPFACGFDDGSLQGWTLVSTDSQGRQFFASVPPLLNSPQGTPQAGDNFIGLHIPAFTLDAPAYTQDSAHGTLLLRSPEFTLNGAGDLTAWLCGGSGYGADCTGKPVANLPAQAFDDPSNPTFPSFLGLALRDVNTGVYVLARARTGEGNEWQQVTITAAQLAALPQDHTYTLDLIDAREGGWGWTSMDSVSIPGTPAGPVNTPPTISNIADLLIQPDSTTGAIPFTIGDAQTDPDALLLTKASSNTTLVPTANIILGGTGANRTVTVTPAPGQTGSATITVTVDDGILTASDSFVLTVSSGTPPLAHEPFLIGGIPASGQYIPGNASGQDPAVTGWSGAWIKAGGDGDVQLYDLGLNHPGLQTSGGQAWAQNATRSGRVLANPCSNSSTGTLYLSLLLKLDSDHPARYRCFELHNGGFEDGGHRVLQLGQHAGDLGVDGFGLRLNNNNALRADLGPVTLQPNLFVFKFVFSTAAAGDSLTIWRNPASLGGSEAAGGTTLSGFDFQFDRTSLASWESNIWEQYFAIHADELRLGTSWASVTPPGGPADNRLVFDFDDGTMQGWTTIRSNTNYSPQAFEVQPAADAHAGGHAIKQRLADTWTGFADLAHETIWIRSPEFTLNGAGDLTLWLMGGAANPLGTPPANESQVPFNSVDTASGGFHGVALRNAATGAFVLLGNRTTNGAPEGPLWEQVTFSAAQLAALDQDATYTLDLIDARNNSWAWVNMDTVAIPGTLSTTPPPDPYANWATVTKGLAGPAADFDADPDGDGLPNGLEFVLGGEPNPNRPGWNSRGLLPTAEAQGPDLVFSYTRTDDSAYLNPTVEFDTDLLAPWTTAVHGVNATIATTPIPGEDAATVTVSIPTNGAPALFARLVVSPPPAP